MAVEITTNRWRFKVTPDDSAPNVYFAVDKKDLVFKSTGETDGELYIPTHGTTSIATTAVDTSGDGVTLATSAAVLEWINSNR